MSNSAVSLQATTAADGGYAIRGVPSGNYMVSVDADEVISPDSGWVSGDGRSFIFELKDAIPTVVSTPSSTGFAVEDGGLYPLGPFTLYPGRRVWSGEAVHDAVSPGGQWTAFLADYDPDSNTGTLEVAGASRAVSPVVLGTGVWSFQFSPDGSSVMFFTNSDGGNGTLNLAAESGWGMATLVATDVSIRGLQFSPNGRQFAFMENVDPSDQRGTLELGSVVTPNQPVQLGTAVDVGYQFSPDGSQLAFEDHLGLSSITVEPLTATGVGTPFQIGTNVVPGFAYSPDGRFMTLAENIDGGSVLELASTTGAALPFILGVGASGAALSPDGDYVAFYGTAFPDGGVPLELMSTSESGGPTSIGVNVSRFQFSPSSQLVAFLEGPYYGASLMLASTSMAGGATVLGQQLSADATFEFSPDSSLIAFISAIRDATGNGSLNLVSCTDQGALLGNWGASAFRFSPDGRFLAFLNGYYDGGGDLGNLNVIAVSTPGTSVQLGTGLPFPGTFTFAPDSTRIAFSTAVLGVASSFGTGALLQLMEGDPDATWADANTLISSRRSSGPPWDFQGGLYAVTVPRVAP